MIFLKKEKPFQGFNGFGGGAASLATFSGGPGKATGGVITVAGGKSIHTFTTPGNFVALEALTCHYLVIAGGGGGGAQTGGGGGAGCFRENPSHPFPATGYQIEHTTYISSLL